VAARVEEVAVDVVVAAVVEVGVGAADFVGSIRRSPMELCFIREEMER
jgi:hypothetical protein